MSMEMERQNAAAEEIISLNIDDLDIGELERRLELAVMKPAPCIVNSKDCNCGSLASCGTYCSGSSEE
jgi:hypothetical protein